MKNKYFLLFAVGLLSLTACADGYKKCKTVKVGSETYSSSEVIKYHVAKYQIIGTNPGLRNIFDDGSGSQASSFFAFFRFGENVKKADEPKFANEAKITVVTSSDSEVEGKAQLVAEVGYYKSYESVYYSAQKKSVKYVKASYEIISKGALHDQLQGKYAYQALYDQNNPTYFYEYEYYTSMYVFKTDVVTTYIDTGTEVVSYTLE